MPTLLKSGEYKIVKLQSQVQTSVLGLGVDFVLPLSQEQQQQSSLKFTRMESIKSLEILQFGSSLSKTIVHKK